MPPCSFPSTELLRMRRQLVERADASNDLMFIRNVAEFVKATDDLRIAHHDITGCSCWFHAAKAAEPITEAA